MQRKRRTGRVAAESYVPEQVQQARTVKVATKDLTNYESVFYTSKARHHDEGTNKYTFEFPGSWRTKSGELLFGIRGIYLKKVMRLFSIGIGLYAREFEDPDTNWKQITCKNYRADQKWLQLFFVYAFKREDTIGTMIASLNEQFLRGMELLMEENEDFEEWWDDIYHKWEWRQEEDGTVCFVPSYPIEKDHLMYGMYYKWDVLPNAGMVRNDVFDIGVIEPSVTKILVGDEEWMQIEIGYPCITMWDRENILITADFVQQADDGHLGYTGIDYNIPKRYEIPHNTVQFTISLFNEATLEPVELPEDGKDYVVIEAILYREYNV